MLVHEVRNKQKIMKCQHFNNFSFFFFVFIFICVCSCILSQTNAEDAFRYRTNFLDMLRFKARLARSHTKNVIAVLAQHEAARSAVPGSQNFTEVSTIHTRRRVPDVTTTSTTTTTTEMPPPEIMVESEPIEFTPAVTNPETTSESSSTEFKCGISSRKRHSRIVGGDSVDADEFPWMVSLVCISLAR